jgi:hypothetical protein
MGQDDPAQDKEEVDSHRSPRQSPIKNQAREMVKDDAESGHASNSIQWKKTTGRLHGGRMST